MGEFYWDSSTSFICNSHFLHTGSVLTDRDKQRDRFNHWGRLKCNWTWKPLFFYTVLRTTLSWLVLVDLSGAMYSWVQRNSILIRGTAASVHAASTDVWCFVHLCFQHPMKVGTRRWVSKTPLTMALQREGKLHPWGRRDINVTNCPPNCIVWCKESVEKAVCISTPSCVWEVSQTSWIIVSWVTW